MIVDSNVTRYAPAALSHLCLCFESPCSVSLISSGCASQGKVHSDNLTLPWYVHQNSFIKHPLHVIKCFGI